MPFAKSVLISWSSGKDSAWALHLLLQQKDVRVAGLLTAFDASSARVAMHAVARELLEAQARRMGLPLWTVDLPWPCPNQDYNKILREVYDRAAAGGVEAVAFGDLFLEDIRAYREQQLQGTGIEPLFPVWGSSTSELALDMIREGVRAKIICVDASKLDKTFAGRDFDQSFLSDLPDGIDSCGENGEFHTFVYDAPMFTHRIEVKLGEIVERDGFVFADFTPAV